MQASGGPGLGESLSSTQCLSLLPELPVKPRNLVHAGQVFTLRHREPLAFQVHLFVGLPFTCLCALSSGCGSSHGLAAFAACPGLNYGAD